MKTKVKKFDDIFDFSMYMMDVYGTLQDTNDMCCVVCFAKYEEAREIICDLILNECDIANVDIESPELDRYNDEFAIFVLDDAIWCEKAKRNDKYLISEGDDVVFILDGCNRALLSGIECDNVVEVQIGGKKSEDKETPANKESHASLIDELLDGFFVDGEEDETEDDEDKKLKTYSWRKLDPDGNYCSYTFSTNVDVDASTLKDIARHSGF